MYQEIYCRGMRYLSREHETLLLVVPVSTEDCRKEERLAYLYSDFSIEHNIEGHAVPRWFRRFITLNFLQ